MLAAGRLTSADPQAAGEIGDYRVAVLNILEDFSSERTLLEDSQRATLNILEDFSAERMLLEDSQRATLNILEDAAQSALELKDIQPAMLNILDDLEVEKETVERLAGDLERRVMERTEELRQTNLSMEAFTYSVAHDLRAPLRAMSGFSEALLDEYGQVLDEIGRGYASRVREASRRMAVLIDELLQLSQVSQAELRREVTDLSAMARSVAAELARQDPARHVVVAIADGLQATVDRTLMRTVLENLIGNAWKFTARRDPAHVTVGALSGEAGQAVCFVRDDGVGFDGAYRDRLFKPFQRLHQLSDFAGNGIGLASVKRIIERHGGRVWAEGLPGQGATFYFSVQEAN